MSKRSAAVKREVSSPITMEDEGRSKRRRVPTSRFDFQFLDNEEQRYLQQVIIFVGGIIAHGVTLSRNLLSPSS